MKNQSINLKKRDINYVGESNQGNFSYIQIPINNLQVMSSRVKFKKLCIDKKNREGYFCLLILLFLACQEADNFVLCNYWNMMRDTLNDLDLTLIKCTECADMINFSSKFNNAEVSGTAVRLVSQSFTRTYVAIGEILMIF